MAHLLNNLIPIHPIQLLFPVLDENFGWYDFSITIKDNAIFEKRFAGHIETGKESMSDPAMG